MSVAMMSFMEFQRELERREIPKQTAFMLATAYEAMLEVAKQQDTASRIMLDLAETMEKVVGSNELVLKQAKRLVEGREDGINVRSVSIADDPEDN